MENNMELDELIGEIDTLMGHDICDNIINQYKENEEAAEPSRDGFDPVKGRDVRPERRDSMQLPFLSPVFENLHPVVQNVIDDAARLWYQHILSLFEGRIGKDSNINLDFLQFCLSGLPPWEAIAEILIVKYSKESKHGYHAFHVDQALTAPEVPELNRFLSLIVYLNDVEEGGETEFWYGQKIKPEKGKVLIFPSVFPFVHKGKIPISNDKYILQIFLNNPQDDHVLIRNFRMMREKLIEIEEKYGVHGEYTGTVGQGSKIGASGLEPQQKYSQNDW